MTQSSTPSPDSAVQTPFVLRGGIVVSADTPPQPLDILCEHSKIAALMGGFMTA